VDLAAYSVKEPFRLDPPKLLDRMAYQRDRFWITISVVRGAAACRCLRSESGRAAFGPKMPRRFAHHAGHRSMIKRMTEADIQRSLNKDDLDGDKRKSDPSYLIKDENKAKALEPDTAVAGIAARAANQVNGLDRLKTELSRATAGCDR
jgi:hypothetical protein